MRRCVLEKHILLLFPNGAKQSTCCGGPTWRDLQTELKKVLCVGAIWQKQSAWLIRTNSFFHVYLKLFRGMFALTNITS